jgi:hypothetical protein
MSQVGGAARVRSVALETVRSEKRDLKMLRPEVKCPQTSVIFHSRLALTKPNF